MEMDLETQTQQQFVPGSTTTTANPITCSTLDSLLSFSCRARAESFARKLQLKLKNLGVNASEQTPGQTLLMMKPSESIPSAKQYYAELSSEIPVADQHIVYSNNNNVTFQDMTLETGDRVNGVTLPTTTETTTTSAPTAPQENGSSSSSDSDYYFDFDIGSPGSPVENGSCYTVINPCDDLYCKECVTSASCRKNGGISGCHQSQGNAKAVLAGANYENGMESGCVVSSPASTSSTSPDNNFSNGDHNEHTKTFHEDDPPEIIQQDNEDESDTREGSLDIPDACSDASDSIYYDVENFSSPSISSSPKESMLSVAESASNATNANTDSSFETASEEEVSSMVDVVEPLCILVQSASLDSIDAATLSQNETPEQLKGQGEDKAESSSEGGKTGLSVDVTQASLHNEYEPQLLSPSTSDDECHTRPRIQRSSSLKTGKTPPGTPGRKKIVRFADVLGLDLADVRTFLDEIPNVPKSAFSDLKDAMELAGISDPTAMANYPKFSKPNKTLLPSFHQPVSMPDYFDKIRDQKVLLENAYLVENFTIKGTVRVKNMDFHKSVYIRYTYNDWLTFTDFMTTYVNGSCDGFSDKFEFTIPLSPNSVEVGGRVSFACRFHCQGQQFWDNNCGRNYVFHCVPSSSQGQQNHLDFHLQSPADDPWVNRMWL